MPGKVPVHSDTENAIRTAIDEMIEGIQIIDADWKYVYLNRAASEHGRNNKDELIGRTMMACYPGIDQTPFFAQLRRVMDSRTPSRMENHFTYPDGKTCWFELFIEPHQVGVLIRSVDITERKSLEEQLRHSQKMEAIGRLAGGVAHDFNNKLGIMLAYGEMAVKHLEKRDEEGAGFVRKILKAVAQSAALVRQLLAFSRRQVMVPRVLNLNTVMMDTRSSLEQLLGERVTLEFIGAPALGNVQADATQVDQVILNLCLNARDAMPDGGTITVETGNVELDEAYTRLHPDVVPGPYVMIAFSDEGCGMTAEIQSKIFEPFFTTKAEGMGTGLGLATVHGIVEQSRGHIWVYSEPNMGSVFKVFLPRIDAPADELRAGAGDDGMLEGTESILLVEDDELLRQAYSSVLLEAGYTVHVAGDPTEAEKLFAKHQDSIHMLLTDVILPRIGGKELSDLLRAKKPGMKVVFMSGYAEEAALRQGVMVTNSVLMRKPISIRDLLKTVRGVLDETLRSGVI